jgi:hypothetical protein
VSWSGHLVVEGLRVGTELDVPLAVASLRRIEAGDEAAGQPRVWTLVAVEVGTGDIERLVGQLEAVLQPGPWYVDLASEDETVVVFADRTFRYPRGDAGGRAAAEAHGRSVGVPDGQLDWPV